MSLTVTSVVLTPTGPYTPGTTITATAAVASSDYTGDLGGVVNFSAAVNVSDSPANSNAGQEFSYSVEGPAPAPDPVTGTVTYDTGARTWTLVSSTEDTFSVNNGSSTWTLVFTTVA